MVNAESRSFRVLVVSDDRKMLRRMSRFLNMFGYQVTQASRIEHAVLVLTASPPDFLVVDGNVAAKHQLQKLQAECASWPNHYTFVFLITEEPDQDDLANALEAGVDDFLSKPLVYGELLARFRAAARTLEYERRVREQSPANLSWPAFVNQLQQDFSNRLAQTPTACVCMEVDFLDSVAARFGRLATQSVVEQTEELLLQQLQPGMFMSNLKNGRFVFALPDQTDAMAIAWAEDVRQKFKEHVLSVPHSSETELHCTASFGISSVDNVDADIEPFLQNTEQALREAQASGRDCVARLGEFDGETKEWEDLATDGKLFNSTTARDVMTPLPFAVSQQDLIGQVAYRLKQSRMNEVAVVDDTGLLAGLVSTDQLVVLPGDSEGVVGDVMTPRPAQFSDSVSFFKLMNFFSDNPDSVVVITQNQRPVGLVHCGVLASLSDPLHIDSFENKTPFSCSSEYLLVSDPGQ